jgi:hypothetical protein
MLRDRFRVLSQIEEPCLKIEEFHLNTPVPDTAQEIRR